MSIIISGENIKTRKIESSKFENEGELQKYIYENPEIIPISEIKEDARLLILSREFPTNSGSIDALGIDQEGEIYIIETKLYRNSDKRRVIAQVLDYGASLYFHSQNFEAFLDLIENDVQRKFGKSLSEKIIEYYDLDLTDIKLLTENVELNLREGKFKFIVLMDELEDRLKDMIKYLNLNSNFDIYGVELDFYKFEGYQIIMPRIYGTEVTKVVKSVHSMNRSNSWNESKFFGHAEENYSVVDLEKVRLLYDFTSKEADELHWGRGEKSGSFNGIYYSISRKPLYFVDSKEWFWWHFNHIEDVAIKERLIDTTRGLGLEITKEYFGSKVSNLSLNLIEKFLKEIEAIKNEA